MNPESKTPMGPVIGSGIVVIMLILGAASLIQQVFKERQNPIVLPVINEYERVNATTTTR